MTQYCFDPIAADTADLEDILGIVIRYTLGDDSTARLYVDHVTSLEPSYDVPDAYSKKSAFTPLRSHGIWFASLCICQNRLDSAIVTDVSGLV